MDWSIDRESEFPLHEQVAAAVRCSLQSGALVAGEKLPPASELAAVLDINANTVLHAYRGLRAEGVLEFKRGRGVRVSPDASTRSVVVEAARHLLAVGRTFGYSPAALASLLEDLS
ncbi:MAG TPA: GntR family transcriptional regulator [Acidimicrobiales bacterium]|nr:GntR family transcriptional regulator [Acidimicrobiales bacterium]